MKTIRFGLWMLLVSLLVSCNGTPQRDAARFEQGDESGIGGTGILARRSGMGGTGIIIGEVTGFGSIFVNGVEVEFNQQTSLYLNGRHIDNYNFARGDVVAVLAREHKGKTRAHRIYIRHEVIGPVKNINRRAGTFRVLGQDIAMTKQVGALPKPGRVVQVSGFRDTRGRIQATRVIKTDRRLALLVGAIRKDPNGLLFIGRQEIRLKDSGTIRMGIVVRVQGHIRNNILKVSRLTVLNEPPFRKPVATLLVQGFISKTGGRTYKIGNIAFEVRSPSLQKQLSSQVGRRIRLKVHRNPQYAWEASKIISPKGLPLGQHHPGPTRGMGNRPMKPDFPQRRNEHPGHFMRR